jgi:hypothetical protein
MRLKTLAREARRLARAAKKANMNNLRTMQRRAKSMQRQYVNEMEAH